MMLIASCYLCGSMVMPSLLVTSLFEPECDSTNICGNVIAAGIGKAVLLNPDKALQNSTIESTLISTKSDGVSVYSSTIRLGY